MYSTPVRTYLKHNLFIPQSDQQPTSHIKLPLSAGELLSCISEFGPEI